MVPFVSAGFEIVGDMFLASKIPGCEKSGFPLTFSMFKGFDESNLKTILIDQVFR
jgi:hypothetical protein